MEKFNNIINGTINNPLEYQTTIIKQDVLKNVCNIIDHGKDGNIKTEFAVIKAF